MDHKLHVLVRLDVDSTAAVLEVSGCLTESNCPALLPIIRRAAVLVEGLCVKVDLQQAKHIDLAGLRALQLLSTGRQPKAAGGDVSFTITSPAVLPACPPETTIPIEVAA
ncbi:hypothetical protein IV498_15900 [Paenarthrobacter sp. Z7-10]|uniref:hypothetical protein n=1 Tax=Paenarthrobacter sp. Z7-10 TaxID=2787635 RepID=UPI0022A8E5B2|nr:hypothetical protein [Paenarthrobacter sp. Z7-10]MCZ2404621.1 hypothetical protein [Paenarthrobacter sp. Z7-10]